MSSTSSNQILIIYVLIVCSLIGQVTYAQDTSNVPADPRDAMSVHLDNLKPDSYAPAKASFAFPNSKKINTQKAAIKLKQIYQGLGLAVSTLNIPSDSFYIDSISGLQRYYPFRSQLPDVYLEKSQEGWTYSAETTQKISDIHKDIYPLGANILLNLSPRIGHQQFLGLAIWKYLGILILIGLGVFAHFLLSRILRPFIGKLIKTSPLPDFTAKKELRQLAKFTSWLILLQFFRLFLPALQLPVQFNGAAQLLLKVFTVFTIALILLRLAYLLVGYVERAAEKTHSRLDEQLLPILKRLLEAIIVIGALLQVLNLLNVNVTALIAGISIGGLALALAAQDTVKNFIGSATIFIDKPFQIGDWIQGDEFAGTVVEVGFRTTKIQPEDTSITTIPNGQLANMSVTNLGMREYRLFDTKLSVAYGTTPALLEQFLNGLKTIILSHPNTRKDVYYVRFNELSESSLDIFYRMWIDVPTYGEEQRVKEDVVFAVIRLAKKLGVKFAYPTTTIHLENTEETNPNEIEASKNIDQIKEKLNEFELEYKKWVEGRDEK